MADRRRSQPSPWRRAGPTDHRYEADVTDAFAVSQVVHAAAQELPPVDLWIYAGWRHPGQPRGRNGTGSVGASGANLTGVSHYAVPALAGRAFPTSFISAPIASGAATARHERYAAAKAGLEAFGGGVGSRSSARTVSPSCALARRQYPLLEGTAAPAHRPWHPPSCTTRVRRASCRRYRHPGSVATGMPPASWPERSDHDDRSNHCLCSLAAFGLVLAPQHAEAHQPFSRAMTDAGYRLLSAPDPPSPPRAYATLRTAAQTSISVVSPARLAAHSPGASPSCRLKARRNSLTIVDRAGVGCWLPAGEHRHT